MEIKGLYEALGISKEETDALRSMKIDAAAQRVMFYSRIVATGGTIHRTHADRRAKNRADNKAARKARKVTRGRSH